MFRFLDQRKYSTCKMHLIQNPNHNIVRHEASRHFRNKKYLKAKTGELESKIKIKMGETCMRVLIILRRVINLEII
jgi:hypothetical protein